MAIVTFPMKLVWTKMVTHNVLHLAFERNDGAPFDFIAGQFISIHFKHNDETLKRSYSIATISTESNLIEIAIAKVPSGAASELLFSLKEGDEIMASGPYGRLILREEETPTRYIFVASGTGITPYRSMLSALEERIKKHNAEVVVLLGVQYRKDLLYGDEFIRFAKAHPQMTFRAQYSREDLSTREPYEHKGYVQTAFPELNLNPENDIVYLCGNPAMIDDAFAELKEIGFIPQNVRREKYISGR